jgi:D-glycero-alpha-D-manno-heptose-7-phosphate kinase
VGPQGCQQFQDRLLVAYCGAPHVSKDVNATWVRQFIAGQYREHWHKMARCSRTFVSALASGDFSLARDMMNQEVDIRCALTPDVLDPLGKQLVAAARDQGCGARFTGAGGGGCIWALGEPPNLELLRPIWHEILTHRQAAKILKTGIDFKGLL